MKNINELQFFVLLFLFLSSCDATYDQSILSHVKSSHPEVYFAANPKPFLSENKDIIENNKKHKVILAIIDTGVDYNHPYLKNNIHYSMRNNPSGPSFIVGKDYVGDDDFAAPYLIQTGTKEIDGGLLQDYLIDIKAKRSLENVDNMLHLNSLNYQSFNLSELLKIQDHLINTFVETTNWVLTWFNKEVPSLDQQNELRKKIGEIDIDVHRNY